MPIDTELLMNVGDNPFSTLPSFAFRERDQWLLFHLIVQTLRALLHTNSHWEFLWTLIASTLSVCVPFTATN